MPFLTSFPPQATEETNSLVLYSLQMKAEMVFLMKNKHTFMSIRMTGASKVTGYKEW